MSRKSIFLAALVGGLLSTSCSGSTDPVEPPARGAESGPATVAERFWPVYRAASAARREGDRSGALLRYEEALAIDPEHGDTLYFLGQMRYERGEIGSAVDYLARLAEAEPRGLRAWQQLSVIAGRPVPGWLVDLPSATEALQTAMELNPAESRNHFLRGRWTAYGGDFDVAIESLEVAAGFNPRFVEGELLGAWIAERQGSLGDATERRVALARELCGADPEACAGAPVARTLRDAVSGDARAEDMAISALPGAAAWQRLAAVAERADLDLDGDGSADLFTLTPGSTGPAMLFAASADRSPVPGTSIEAWEAHDTSGGLGRSTPWSAVGIRRIGAPALLAVAGGGARPLRFFDPATGAEAAPSMPLDTTGLTLPVLASGDVDGDGADELLVANLPDPTPGSAGGLVGLLLRPVEGGFDLLRVFPGPLSAAHIGDLDGDGDADVALGRYPGPQGITEERLVAAVGEDGTAGMAVVARPSALALWTNVDGDFLPADVPHVDLPVRALAAGWGPGPSLYVASGDLDPERPALDRLYRFTPDGAAATSVPRPATSPTLVAVRLGPGRLLLRRGGLVPADPAEFDLLESSPAAR